MLKKVKKFKDVKLNSQDVLVYSKTLKQKSDLIIPDDSSKEVEELMGKEWMLEIIAVGDEVKAFSVGEIVVNFKSPSIPEAALDPTDVNSDSIIVTHMNNIAMATTRDNYENS